MTYLNIIVLVFSEMSGTLKGKYTPRHPHKYKGDPLNIIYRSSWERTFMKWADLSEGVLSWESEEKCLWYYDPVTKKKRRYFPDFIIRTMESDGLIVTSMIEIKPYKQVVGPEKQPKRRTKSWAQAVNTYVTNMAKWEAARAVCEDRGWRFKILTEYELGLKKRK
jgi:hypothetical protein